MLAGRDSSAPSANTLQALRRLQPRRPKLDIVEFPTAEHGMVEFEEASGGRVEIAFAAGYFQLIVDWVHTKEPRVRVPGPVVYDGAALAPSAQ